MTSEVYHECLVVLLHDDSLHAGVSKEREGGGEGGEGRM